LRRVLTRALPELQLAADQRESVLLALEAVQRAPLGEIGPVDAVGLERVGRLGMGGVVACVLGHLLEPRQGLCAPSTAA